MLHLSFTKHKSIFKSPGGTSRGVLHTKDSWIISVWNETNPAVKGVGEVSIIEGLSVDPVAEIEAKLHWLSANIHLPESELMSTLIDFPAIQFGLECALLDLKKGGKQILFDSDFTLGKKPIPINGLVWMGSFDEMRLRIIDKLNEGYNCIKIKVGAIDFEQELALIKQIRSEFSVSDMEIRVDANGGFTPENAEQRLTQLAKFDLHSIEQPIKQGQWNQMVTLCEKNILPIALDEELIGITGLQQKMELLDFIKPQYIILKPSLLGGFAASDEWIRLAEERNNGWWATSALETNIGLNAIAQWTATKQTQMPQGLGTGQLFINNFTSGLTINKGELWLLS